MPAYICGQFTQMFVWEGNPEYSHKYPELLTLWRQKRGFPAEHPCIARVGLAQDRELGGRFLATSVPGGYESQMAS